MRVAMFVGLWFGLPLGLLTRFGCFQVRENMNFFVIWGVTAAVCSVGSGILFGVAGMRYVRRLRSLLIESLMVQEMAFFDTTSPGALISHLTADTVRQ